MSLRTFGHRAPLFWLVIPFMGGLAAADAGLSPPSAAALGAALLAALAALLAAERSPALWIAGISIAMAAAGDASHRLHRHRLAGWDDRPPREMKLFLRVERAFPAADERRTTGLARIQRAELSGRELIGQKIYYSLALRPPANLGAAREASAEIEAFGVLSVLPEHPPDSTFDGSLAAQGVNFKLGRGRVLAVTGPPDRWHRLAARIALRMNVILSEGFSRHPGLAGIYRAMMLGQKRDLPPDQRQVFLHSGTMHLFAINGLHIGIVALAFHALLALLRCPRPAASALVLAVLWVDVGATGSSPSAVRAFIMVAALEAAYVFRRPANLLSTLATSALVVLLLDPWDFFTASFRMSYGVMTVIGTLGLPLAARLSERFAPFRDLPKAAWDRRHHALAWIKSGLLEGIGVGSAAALAGAVTGIQYFGVFVPGGLPANLLFLPPAMLVIVAGFSAGLAGLLGTRALSLLFNHAAAVLLWMIAAGVGLAARIPGFWFPAHARWESIGPAALAALLAACLAGYGWRWRSGRGGFWPPFAIVALAIALGVKLG